MEMHPATAADYAREEARTMPKTWKDTKEQTMADATKHYTATLQVNRVDFTPAVQHRYPEQRVEEKRESSSVLAVTLRSTSLEALARKIAATLSAEMVEGEDA